jgi:hypothetical protein
MKTSIYISGQIAGNNHLVNACNAITSIKVQERMFYAKEIFFNTKKDAKKALWQAFRLLKQDEPDYKGIRYYKRGMLIYDASQAEIINS